MQTEKCLKKPNQKLLHNLYQSYKLFGGDSKPISYKGLEIKKKFLYENNPDIDALLRI